MTNFNQNLGFSINPPNNQLGIIQPNIVNNNILIANTIREPYETVNLAEFKLVRDKHPIFLFLIFLHFFY